MKKITLIIVGLFVLFTFLGIIYFDEIKTKDGMTVLDGQS